MFSSQFEWHMDREIYHFLASAFDVVKAKQIVVKKPREISEVKINGLADLVKRPVNGMICIGHIIDWDKVDGDSLDMTFPIICVLVDGSYWPIDGWHRIAKALDQGTTSLPGVLLDEKETKRVKIR